MCYFSVCFCLLPWALPLSSSQAGDRGSGWAESQICAGHCCLTPQNSKLLLPTQKAGLGFPEAPSKCLSTKGALGSPPRSSAGSAVEQKLKEEPVSILGRAQPWQGTAVEHEKHQHEGWDGHTGHILNAIVTMPAYQIGVSTHILNMLLISTDLERISALVRPWHRLDFHLWKSSRFDRA